MRRTLTLIVAAVTVALGLTACAPADKAEIGADAVVIDVRTNDEQASGYLEGALLLDINSGALESALPALDPNAEYLIYCRSGNRADQAIALMEQAGFTNLTNLGSLAQAASATGLPIVTADSSTPAPSTSPSRTFKPSTTVKSRRTPLSDPRRMVGRKNRGFHV